MRLARTNADNARRRELIEAAYLTFIDHGMTGMTMARIGERAGMSHGIVNYYFRSKDELLSVVVRKIIFAVMSEVMRRIKNAQTPRERVSAIIAGHFDEKLFTAEVARAWISYYAMIGSNRAFQRTQAAADRRLHSNLLHALKQITDGKTAKDITCILELMIDGAWLRRAHSAHATPVAEIIRCMETAVDDGIKAAAIRRG
jgi:TetR/AcrR family transcriptional regulator, transcriptional repressor of bet genes